MNQKNLDFDDILRKVDECDTSDSYNNLVQEILECEKLLKGIQ